MSQGAVKDLPDPLDTPVASQGAAPSGGSPDDLLSQMADEAIDKLIADSEKGTSAASSPADPVSPANDEKDPPAPVAELQTELDSVFDKLDQSADPSPASEPAAEAPSDASGLELVEPPALEPQPAEPEPSPPGHPVPSIETPPPPAPEQPAIEPPPAEPRGRSPDVKALLDEAVATAPRASGESVAGSILLLPLRLLNAPFGGLGDRTRDALGQIGIVTLLNAIAVLVYVLWFRRGH